MNYLQNRIDLQVELYDKVTEKVKDLGDKNDNASNSLRFLLMSQLMDCALRISELTSVYLHLNEKDYELPEDIKATISQLKPTFYVKKNKLYAPNDVDYDSFINDIQKAYTLKDGKQ
jgi:hypothetical protein